MMRVDQPHHVIRCRRSDAVSIILRCSRDLRTAGSLGTLANGRAPIAEWSMTGRISTDRRNGSTGKPGSDRWTYFWAHGPGLVDRFERRVCDGLIVNYREYWNPLAFQAAMSGARFDA
ncbi:MAG: hypothetical protein V4537_08805 [Pseudomonadota bacterium]